MCECVYVCAFVYMYMGVCINARGNMYIGKYMLRQRCIHIRIFCQGLLATLVAPLQIVCVCMLMYTCTWMCVPIGMEVYVCIHAARAA